MSVNVGSADKAIRIILGALLIALPFVSGLAAFSSSAATIGSVVVGVVLIATALFSFCPIYRVLGIGTSSKQT